MAGHMHLLNVMAVTVYCPFACNDVAYRGSAVFDAVTGFAQTALPLQASYSCPVCNGL